MTRKGLKINRRETAKGGNGPHARASLQREDIQANPKLIALSHPGAAEVYMTTGKGNCSEGNSVGAGSPLRKACLSSQTSSVESTRGAMDAEPQTKHSWHVAWGRTLPSPKGKEADVIAETRRVPARESHTVCRISKLKRLRHDRRRTS